MAPHTTLLSRFLVLVLGVVLALATLAQAAGPAAPLPGKPGGVLNLLQREETTTGFAIHETATIATVWPASPCFSNLVIFDPFKPRETMDTVIGELAEKWSWQDNYRNLVFFDPAKKTESMDTVIGELAEKWSWQDN